MVAVMPDESNLERVHRLFRGSGEAVKVVMMAAFWAEVIVAAVAIWRTFIPDVWSAWASLFLAAVVASALLMRKWANSVKGYSERCRRIAVRAHAFGRDVSASTVTTLSADAPPRALRYAKTLPAQNLSDYYEVVSEVGSARFREIYAHSAYYTWRLSATCSRIYGALALLFALAGAMLVYALAAEPVHQSLADRLLDMVCSVIFVFFVAKAVEAWWDYLSSASECRSIVEKLTAANSATQVEELAIEYDIERSGGRMIPTSIYLAERDKLQHDWHLRRAELGVIEERR